MNINNIKSINFSNNNNKNNKNNNNKNNNNKNNNNNIDNNNNKNNNINNNNDTGSINNIFFNNLGENNITKFISNDQDILIEEEIAIKDSEILYSDDIVYLKELENQLLSEYQVSKQSVKFIQKEVEKVAKKIIEVKNLGIKQYEMNKNGIEYNLIDNIINDIFINNLIIPIVLDKHRIYTKLKEDEINENQEESDIYFSESLENKDGIIEENQRLQFIELKNMYHLKALDKISYKNLLNNEMKLIKPYISVYKKNNIENIGYIKKPNDNILVLRYNDLNSIHWNTYNTNSNYIFNKDIIDETGKIKGVEEDIFINGDEINIIGYMVVGNKNVSLNKKFDKIGLITKIFNSANSIIIECINHGLKENEVIYLEETNSFPKINNTFSKSVKIIDKDLIELNVNTKLEKEGNYGVLYALSSLKFDLYNVSKENDNIIMTLKESKYNNSSNLNNHNKIYLFDNININKEDYINIIKKIIPNINDIFNIESKNINNSYTFNDINNIFKKYSLSMNSLKVEQISIIKSVFEKNLEKIINKKNNNIITLNFNKNNKKYFTMENYFLSDKYIKNNDIEKLYGKYIFYNKPEDNLILRLKWIEMQKDNGKLYYLYYLLDRNNKKNNKKSNQNINYINSKIEELEKNISEINKNLKKEKNSNKNKLYKYQAYIITDTDAEDGFKILKKTLMDDTIVFYKDNLYIWKGKLVDFENIEDNTLALVGNKLWTWKNNKWNISLSNPKYNDIRYLCELNNIDLENIKLDSLECIYRKDIGCNTKLYIRFEESLKKLKNDLENFNKLKEYIINNTLVKNIKNQINELIKKFYFGVLNINYSIKDKKLINKHITNENITNENITNDHITNDQLFILIKLINGIQNNDLKLNYIYTLIEKDGLLIGNDIYSKKYNRKLGFCGHYYFFKKMNYSDNPDDKIKITKIMLDKYSDYGETEKNLHTCKCCGMFLSINEYDDTEGYSASGAIIKSREVWEIEKKNIIQEKIDLFDYARTSNLEDKGFKELLLKYGLSINDIDESITILNFIIKNLYSKIGVKLENTILTPSSSFISILLFCI
jgi:hypothetical protein